MKYSNHITLIIASFLLSSLFAASPAWAQCTFFSAISVSTSGHENGAGYTQEFVLVDDVPDTIVAINTSGNFTGLAASDYRVYAVNYDGATPAALAIGNTWTTVDTYDANTANCFEAIGPYLGGAVTVCDTIQVCEPNNLVVSTTNYYTGTGFDQYYVLVNLSGTILAYNTSGVFPFSAYGASGIFHVYAVNTDEAAVVAEIADLGPWSDVSAMASPVNCAAIIGPRVAEVIDILESQCQTLILPIELVRFEGEALETMNRLHWVTATETNTVWHVIERSKDGHAFEPVGKVAAKANARTATIYAMDDEEAFGDLYYRLKSIDNNGAFSYSNIIYLEREQAKSLRLLNVAPNPTANEVQVQYETDDQQDLVITVHDMLGKLVYVYKGNPGEGQHNIPVNLEAQPAGVYVLQIANGKHAFVERVVKR